MKKILFFLLIITLIPTKILSRCKYFSETIPATFPCKTNQDAEKQCDAYLTKKFGSGWMSFTSNDVSCSADGKSVVCNFGDCD